MVLDDGGDGPAKAAVDGLEDDGGRDAARRVGQRVDHVRRRIAQLPEIAAQLPRQPGDDRARRALRDFAPCLARIARA